MRPFRARMPRKFVLGVVLVAGLVLPVLSAAPTPAAPDAGATPAELRLNHIQVKGSHNSYHVEPGQGAIDVMIKFRPDAYLLQYSHDPLTVQFEDQGVRQIELDVYADPAGDLAYPPKGTPGWKVAHIEQVDMRSTCPLLTDCLEEMLAWSDANPTHVPITVLLELKDTDDIPIGGHVPVPIDAALLHDLDSTIRQVIPENRLVTPDFVRGVGRAGGADGSGTVYPDVNTAVTTVGWPLLDDVRGRFLFLLDNKRGEYLDGDPILAGRVAFPPSSPGQPETGFVKRNDSVADHDAIVDAVEAGYLVRTRADYPVETGLSGDDTDLLSALDSGAHFVSGDYLTPTDYERYDAAFAAYYGLAFDPTRPPYETVVPGGQPVRCNPRTAPPGCTSSALEDLPLEPTTTTTATPTTAAPGSTTEPPNPTTTSTTGATSSAPAPPTPAATPQIRSPAYTG